jgi:hypothetical protein
MKKVAAISGRKRIFLTADAGRATVVELEGTACESINNAACTQIKNDPSRHCERAWVLDKNPEGRTGQPHQALSR